MPWVFAYPVPIWSTTAGYSFSPGGQTSGTGATATATVSGGSVTAIAPTTNGTGYTVPPTVVLTGGGGTGGTATASVSGGSVTTIVVDAGGTGYSTPPTVVLSGGGGTGATATATVSGGVITGYTITNAGTGYTSSPTVSLYSAGGTGATATAILTDGQVTGYTITNGGTGYTTPPTVTLIPAPTGGSTASGPDVTTGGSFGPAPVQISATYTAQHSGHTIVYAGVIALNVAVTGIASVNQIGLTSISTPVTPLGIPSAAVIGSTTITAIVNIAPSGIPSTAQTGNASVSVGILSVLPAGIASTVAIGLIAIDVNIPVSATGLASTTVSGVATVSVGDIAITPAGAPSGSQIGTSAIIEIVTPSGIVSSAVIGASTVEAAVTINPAGIPSTAQIGAAVVALSLKSNLISWWALDESSGTFNDSHGTNHTTTRSSVGSVTGKVGNAADFTGSTGSYAEVTSNSSLQTGDIAFTVCCWVKMDTVGAYRLFVCKDGSGSREWQLNYDRATEPTNPDRFRFSVYRATDADVRLSATSFGAPSTGVWYFLCAWHDPTIDTMYIQVNNGTVDSRSVGGSMQAAGSQPFSFGRYGSGAFGIAHDGQVDEVGFWKRLLTADERTFLYNSGNGRAYSELT